MNVKVSPLVAAAGIAFLESVVFVGLILGDKARESWGSWLGGVLTSAIVLFALLSYLDAEDARAETARTNALTAEINQRSAFLTHVDKLERHLSYKGTCALLGVRVSDADHQARLHGKMAGYEYIWTVLDRRRKGSAVGSDFWTQDSLQRQPLWVEFLSDLKSVQELAGDARMEFLLDYRIREIPMLIALLPKSTPLTAQNAHLTSVSSAQMFGGSAVEGPAPSERS